MAGLTIFQKSIQMVKTILPEEKSAKKLINRQNIVANTIYESNHKKWKKEKRRRNRWVLWFGREEGVFDGERG